MNQQDKIMLFRVLKVVFYCLGLPLFFMAVLALSTMFLGEAPFAGAVEDKMFASLLVPLKGTALYGVWIALGIWAFLGAMQILFHYVIKNRRVRMIVTTCVILVTMLVPVFVMDAVFTKQIDAIAASAPDGVKVESYKTQLSYYKTVTSSGGTSNGKMKSRTDELIKNVEKALMAYNISYNASFQDGTASTYNNVPITYAYLGIDINKDGYIDSKDDILVLERPTGGKADKKTGVVDKESGGVLVLKNVKVLKNVSDYKDVYQALKHNGIAAKHYDDAAFDTKATYTLDEFFYVPRTKSNGTQDVTTYLWYSKNKMSAKYDGTYGYAGYVANGILTDGYVYSLNSVLEILEDYYASKAEIDKLVHQKGVTFDAYHAELLAKGEAARRAYYLGEEYVDANSNGKWDEGETYVDLDGNGQYTDSSDALKLQYYKETYYFYGDFELAPEKLDKLVSMLGSMLGNNFLFDFVADLLSGMKPQLNVGVTLNQFISGLFKTIETNLGDTLRGFSASLGDTLFGEPYTDTNSNGKWDVGEPFTDHKNGKWDTGEWYNDANGNGKYDEGEDFVDVANGKYDPGIVFTICGDGTPANPGMLNKLGLGDAILQIIKNVDANGNGKYDGAETFTDTNANGKWDTGEPYVDANGNGKYDASECFDANGNGIMDEDEKFFGIRLTLKVNVGTRAETFTDINLNGIYDVAEPYNDVNLNGKWDTGEPYTDTNANGTWDAAEPWQDKNLNGVWDGAGAADYKVININLNEKTSLGNLTNILSGLVDVLQNMLGMDKSTIDTVVGLVKGLVPTLVSSLGFKITVDKTKPLDVKDILMQILKGLYWYQSPILKPVYQFYLTSEDPDSLEYKLQQQFAIYDMAEYAGSRHGTAVGSVIIGDKIGDGNFTQKAHGFANLLAVQQLKTDLSYKPTMYPLFSVRDMLLVFAGIVVMFTILSFFAAEKQEEWENGTAVLKNKKSKKSKGGKKGANVEDTAILASENNGKEVR